MKINAQKLYLLTSEEFQDGDVITRRSIPESTLSDDIGELIGHLHHYKFKGLNSLDKMIQLHDHIPEHLTTASTNVYEVEVKGVTSQHDHVWIILLKHLMEDENPDKNFIRMYSENYWMGLDSGDVNSTYDYFAKKVVITKRVR